MIFPESTTGLGFRSIFTILPIFSGMQSKWPETQGISAETFMVMVETWKTPVVCRWFQIRFYTFFYPKFGGRWIEFDLHIFQMGVEKADYLETFVPL